VIAAKKQEFAECITHSMGKTITVSNLEVDISVACCNLFCDGAAKWLANEPIEGVQGGRAYIRYDPHGVVLSIAPFNFPLFTAIQNSIGNVIAGNTSIIKPEESCAAVGELLNQAAAEAGLSSEYQVLFLTFAQVQRIINDRRTVGVSFTGSTMGGSAIAGMAA
jgi:succinate-semialdehyde dehydrogenase/glutarate-semialdehyde dehydrogenase